MRVLFLRRFATLALLGAVHLFSLPANAQPSFDMSITPSTIGPGSATQLRFDISNAGGIVQDLAFTNNLPAGVTIATPANSSSTCLGILSAADGASTVALTDGDLGASESCSITVDVTSATPGVHTNTSGDLTSDVGNSGNSSADLTIATDRPGFTKSFSPSAVLFGGRSTLTLTIDNSANTSIAASIRFTDTFPGGLEVASPTNATADCTGGVITAVSGTDVVSYQGGWVAAGAVCSVVVDVVNSSVGVLGNTTGDLTSSYLGPQKSSGKAAATLNATSDRIVLTQEFTGDPVGPGGSVNLSYTIHNLDRGSNATQISFTDNLDATLSGLVATATLSDPCGAGSSLTGTGTLTFTGGDVAPEATCTFSVPLQVPGGASAGEYTNSSSTITANIASAPVVGSPASDILFVSPVPAVTLEFIDDPVAAGDDVTVRFEVTNGSSTSDATDLAFLTELTTFLPFPVSAVTPADPCGVGSSISLVFLNTESQGLALASGELSQGASCSFDVTVTISSGVSSGIYPFTTSEITATVDGSTVTGASTSDDLTIVAGPKLVKEFIDDPTPAGGSAVLEFTVTHDQNATADATGISFSDDLNAALSGLVSTSATQNDVCGIGSTLSGTTNITLIGGTLTPGETCTFSVTTAVPAGAASGNHTNQTSSVQSTVAGLSLTGNIATDDLTVAGVTLTKEFTDSPVRAGSTTNLRFTIENVSPTSDATAITFSDNLDDMLDGAVVTSGTQTDPCGTGSELILAGGDSLVFLTGGSLTSETSCTIDVEVLVPSDAADDTYLNVTSSLTATIDGTANVVFDGSSADLTVQSRLLHLEEEFINDPVSPGSTTTLRFTITSLDPNETISLISFSDDLGAALSGLVSSSGTLPDVCGVGSQITGTDTLAFTGGTLGPSGTCSFDVTVAVPATTPLGTVGTNTTSQIIGGINKGFYILKAGVFGDPATDNIHVDFLDFTKSFDGTAEVGTTTTLTFNILNVGSVTAEGISFTDDLDAMLSGLVAAGLPAADVCGPGSELSGTSVLSLTGGTILPNGSCTFSVVLDVPTGAAPGAYENVTSDIFIDPSQSKAGDPATATLNLFVVPTGCADRTSIDYKGYTANSCAAPQNAVSVFDQQELEAYMTDFGFDGTKVKNVKVMFNPTGDTTIISPCEILLRGDGGYLDVTADKVCLFGGKGIEVGGGSASAGQSLTAQTLGLVSEEGASLIKQKLSITASEVSVVAHKEARIGNDSTVTVTDGSLSLVSEGDLASSDANIRSNSVVTAGTILVSASRTAKLGSSTDITATGTLDLLSTGTASGSVATIESSSLVSAGIMNQVSGNKVNVGQNAVVNVTGNYHLNADGNCTIKSSATINAGSTSGNCFP